MSGRPAGPGPVVIVVAHGSRAEQANDAHRHVVSELAGRVAGTVHPAFLELAEPSIPDAIDAAIAAGAAPVLVLPYFLYPGRHLTRDLPAIVADATQRHPGHEISLLDLFGARPGVVDVLAAQVEEALDPT